MSNITDLTEINTFWKLISSHRVEIPIIQRDYAQGRDISDDPKAAQVREDFIRDLVTHLETKKTPMHLDFVYGKINGKIDAYTQQRNRVAIDGLLRSVRTYSESLDLKVTYHVTNSRDADGMGAPATSFIPLDGQQRLTTLFLLHWYLMTRTGANKSALLNFTYKTRTSSISFCNALATTTFTIDIENAPDQERNKVLSEKIADSYWFVSNWKKDPTVKGMLTVLDEIHFHLGKLDTEALKVMLSALIRTDIISFDFLDMDKFELTDDLYVKMNARGKQLTNFENFKTWLQEYVKTERIQITVDRWHDKLDIQWTDLFWQYKTEGTYQIDDQYMAFFNFMCLNTYSENLELKDNKISKAAVEVWDELRGTEFIPSSFYLGIDAFSQRNVNRILKTLHFLQDDGLTILRNTLATIFNPSKNDILNKLFGADILDVNYWDRCFLDSIIKFILYKEKNLGQYTVEDQEQLFQWARICKNLIYNTIIDSTGDFVSAQRSIEKLIPNCLNMYAYFASENIEAIAFLSPQQVAEEKTKSKLILHAKEWEQELIACENHEYFYGQVDFLLQFSLLDEQYDLDKFQFYSKKAQFLFSSQILDDANLILQRALLTKGNYLVNSGGNLSFCLTAKGTVRLREENWRRLFRHKEKSLYLKALIEDDRSLSEIISSFTMLHWRDVLVHTPKCIKYCNQRLINVKNDSEVTLLGQSQFNHKHAELYSYAFFKQLEKAEQLDFPPFLKQLSYKEVKSTHDDPAIRLNNWAYKNSLYAAEILSEGIINKFRIEFFNLDNVVPNMDIQSKLIEQGYLTEGVRLVKYLDQEVLKDQLHQLCGFLEEITTG